MEFNINPKRWTPIWALAILLFGSAPAKADLFTAYLSWEIDYQQTGPSTVLLQDAIFDAYSQLHNAGDYTSGTLSYPGAGSPQTLSPDVGGIFLEYSTQFADFSSLQAAYPFGAYTFQGFGPSGPSSAISLDYTANQFPNIIPALTADSFNALQDLNPANSITVNFNSGGTIGQFYVISDNFDIGFDLSPSDTSVVIPGGTLAANTAYTYGLLFANQDTTTDSGIFTGLSFESATNGNFTTSGVPEPQYSAILALALAGLIVVHRRRSAPACH